MYYYVYDEFVQDPKFERELAQIETRLTDLGISGKIARLALFRDASELIRDAARKGAKTIIAVGNDLTLRKVIDAAADHKAVLGVIPLGKEENNIAHILGIPHGVAACDVISARMVEALDIGMINGHRFINSCIIEDGYGMEMICDNNFKIFPTRKGAVEIRNLALADDTAPAANPSDGMIELVVRLTNRSFFSRKKGRATVVPVKDLLMKSEKTIRVRVDGELFEGEDFRISVIPNHLKLIIGRERKF